MWLIELYGTGHKSKGKRLLEVGMMKEVSIEELGLEAGLRSSVT